MAPDLRILAQKKDALLVAEIGAWLHMFGKFHEDFLKGNEELAKQIPQDLKQNYTLLDNLLTQTWIGQILQQIGIPELNVTRSNIENLIKQHQKPDVDSLGLERLMWDAHGRGSGLEKGLLARFTSVQCNIVHLSTAFGYEKHIDLKDIENKRKFLYNYLETQLAELRKTNGQPSAGWLCFRKSFISMISKLFLLSVGDTRRPLNDVSLFDQTVASVAFFKAALAQIILLQKWKEPNTKITADKYHWRILRVGFNGVAFWAKSSKISDIDARKQLIPPFLNEVQNLIETDYPVGYEIYRDEMGSVFIMPDMEDLLNSMLDDGKTLAEKISEISRNHLKLEASIQLFPVSSRTRNMQSFGELVSNILLEPFPDKNSLNHIQKLWSKCNEVCIVCRLRPHGPSKKAISRNVCDICEERRLDRSKLWSEKLNHTIWIDEVADLNGRIALIVGTFDLKDWLNGKLISSVVAFDPSKRQLTDINRNNRKYSFDYYDLLNEIGQRLKNHKQSLGGKSLVDNLILKDQRGGFTQFGDIYDLYVSDSDLRNSQKEDWRFALAMIRQQPSPARIFRIWETTKNFWNEIQGDFDKSVGQVDSRLEIRGDLLPNKTEDTLGLYHVYEFRLENIKLSMVWDYANKRFISAENLEHLAQTELLGENVPEWFEKHIGQKIRIEESLGYGTKNKEWGSIKVDKASQIINSNYIPVIPILAEPSTFMAIVPANKALNVVNSIKNKYETEMNKVRNRLPLTLGLVFARSHTPVAAIMDAGRRMLKIPEDKDAIWKIESDPRSEYPNWIELTLKKNERLIKVKVNTVMGDGIDDVWYPYWHVESDTKGNIPSGRKRQFIGHNQKHWVHINDLQEGDNVEFIPSRIDFEFLDSAARRFEISYNEGKRRDKRKSSRPYYLEELADFEKIWGIIDDGLARTQIKGIIGLIETKREEWKADENNEIFRAFVHDVIQNANWKNGKPSEIDEIENAAVSGKLNDIVELYMDILKENEKELEKEEKNE